MTRAQASRSKAAHRLGGALFVDTPPLENRRCALPRSCPIPGPAQSALPGATRMSEDVWASERTVLVDGDTAATLGTVRRAIAFHIRERWDQ